jgi:predicted nucleic acid-binding protein
MIVTDTNIIAHLFISGELSEAAAMLATRDADWRAPPLWRSEFRSVLAQYLRQGLLVAETAGFIMQEAEAFINAAESEISSAEVLAIIASSSLSAYDCEFVALARRLHCRLVTEDRKILREFPDLALPLAQAIL